MKRVTLLHRSFLVLLLVVISGSPVIAGASELSKPTDQQLITSQKKKLVQKWTFPGSEMSPAEMYFWDNGLLVVDSEIFSKEKREYYFLWNINKNQSLLTITYIDKRIPLKFLNRAELPNIGRSVESVDLNKKAIIYFIKNKRSVDFNGWIFSGEPLRGN